MDIYYHKSHYWYHKKIVLIKMTGIKVEVCYGYKTSFLILFQLGAYHLTFRMGEGGGGMFYVFFPPELKKCIDENDWYQG